MEQRESRPRPSARSTLRTRWDTRLRYLRSSGALTKWLLWSVGALAVMWISWIVVTGLVVRSDAAEIRDRLHRIEAQVAQGDLAGARQTAAAIPELARSAHTLTSGPAWWAAANIPYLGRPFEIARGATKAADRIGTDGIPALLQIADELDPHKLRTSPRTIDLAPLVDAAPGLAGASATLDAALGDLNATPRSSWVPGIDALRTSLETSLRSVSGYVDAAASATRILPGMLGADRPQRYFIGLQNEAEMRGTGGLPGAFAIAVATKGTIRFTHFESDSALLPKATGKLVRTNLNFGAQYAALYGDASGPTSLFINSNLSPHFPYAARIWAAMWEKVSGEHVDGALAVDPEVLANLLRVTGPVTTPENITLGASNVVQVTESTQYTMFADNNVRKDFLVHVLKATSTRVLDGSAPAVGLARAVTRSAKQHRFLVWTSDARAQAVIDETDYSGSIPATDRPFVGMVLNNIAAGKLDYYLHRSVSYQRIGCGSERDMVVTLTLTNSAPASGLPRYVAGRVDDFAGESAPGDNRVLLDYYATAEAQLVSVTIDGQAATSAVQRERGHPVYRIDMELPRARTRTVVLHLAEPAGTGTVDVWHQPGVLPLDVSGIEQPCP